MSLCCHHSVSLECQGLRDCLTKRLLFVFISTEYGVKIDVYIYKRRICIQTGEANKYYTPDIIKPSYNKLTTSKTKQIQNFALTSPSKSYLQKHIILNVDITFPLSGNGNRPLRTIYAITPMDHISTELL